MPSKRRPQARRARRPRAGKTKSTSINIAKSRRTHKADRFLLADLTARRGAARDRALHVIAAMRRDPKLSLARACRLMGVKPETVLAYFVSAFTRSRGRFHVRKSDRYAATLYVPDSHGNSVAVETHSSKDRALLSAYLRDLGRYLRGQREALAAWHGKRIAGVQLLTAGRTIVGIEPALSDFSLYRVFNGGAV